MVSRRARKRQQRERRLLAKPGVPVICVLRSDQSRVPSLPTVCRDCGVGLWVSVTMAARVAAGEVYPTCSVCGGLFDDVQVVIHPDQRDELAAHGVLGAAERLVRRMNNGTGGHAG